jgi:hypothetical protein
VYSLAVVDFTSTGTADMVSTAIIPTIMSLDFGMPISGVSFNKGLVLREL